MSGFTATKDPLQKGARVTSVIVEDPLYPHGGSSVWGRSPAPGSTLSVVQLGRQFVRRRQSTLSPHLSYKYVLVLPFEFNDPLLRLRLSRRDVGATGRP
jgi:hypothetical protein